MKNCINIEIIKKYISDNKLSKTTFCKKCKISNNTFDKICNGSLRVNAKSLFKIAMAMNMNIVDILTIE